MKLVSMFVIISIIGLSAFAQTKDAYDASENTKSGLFDKSRLSIQHSLNFGMMSASGISNLKSQSLYGTMFQYSFVAPVTINLNFELPIHSTFTSAQNLNAENVKSLDYFKTMPVDFNITWKPTDKLHLRLNVAKSDYQNEYYGYGYGQSRYNRFFPFSGDDYDNE